VGWICALKLELDASLKMFDIIHERGFGHGSDHNLYILGRIGNFNVVLTCLPMGQYGSITAAIVATRMMSKFPNIKIGLMVGIGGGLPNKLNDIRLGDVAVSKPGKLHGGVVQYEMGKFTTEGFEATGYLSPPPERLLVAVNMMPPHGTPLGDLHCPVVPYPGEKHDRLYKSEYKHVGVEDNTACQHCDVQQLIERGAGNRETVGPHVFYGTIASGNAVIKDAFARDKLIQRHSILCFEMEAAGLMNSSFPCLVIRGISDYADSHKNDGQPHTPVTFCVQCQEILRTVWTSTFLRRSKIPG
jgi:nucleoside phosphorylase